MGRGKIAKRFVENARARATRYAKRTQGLQKQASELSVLCGVPVALVCAPAAGAGAQAAQLVWESEEGVLDRYRAAAIPPETRAGHTHRSYLEAELGKERAKLARARPAALADWDPALNDMTLHEAREVLDAIDAALRATGDRMQALRLPADGRLDQKVALVPDRDASNGDDADATVAPQQLGLDHMDIGTGFQLQMMPYHGGSNDHCFDGQPEQFLVQPEYGLECVGSNDVGAMDETQAPAGYGDNADCRWPDLTMWYAAEASWDAVMPTGYYPDFADAAQDVTGGDYANTLPIEYPMGMDENFAYLDDMDNSYAAHWQAQEFQRSDTGTGHYQCSDPEAYRSGQVFNYCY
uniref:Uncharacterized protein n=1 Tax=Avena sativa TaxID=4498 RepID=A0ACD6ADG4_AVESA